MQHDTVPGGRGACRVEAPDRLIARVAAAQNGVVTLPQLLELGLTRKAVRHRVAIGRLHPAHRGIYLVGHPVAPSLARETAAVLACRDGAVLSHHSAAALWRLRAALPAVVDVTVAGRNPGRRDGIRVHRVRSLDALDRTRRHGLPITTPARTILDQATVASPRDLERVLDEARIQRLTSDSMLLETLGRAPNHPGTRALRTLLASEEEPHLTRSEAEERMLALVRAADLPPFETNHRVLGHRVDFLWRTQRVVVEVDGWRFHRDRRRFEDDRRRDADLQAAGHVVLRITPRRLRQEAFFVAARLGAALSRSA